MLIVGIITMDRHHAIVALAILFDLIHCESIITPPEDVSEMVGSIAMFHCDIEFDQNPMMAWEHNDKVIYSYYAGAENYKINHGKYSVKENGRRFTLTVNHLEYKDGGTYACLVVRSKVAANLIVLDTPVLDARAPSYHLGNVVFFSCKSCLGRPPKQKISRDHFPKLHMNIDRLLLEGTTEEQEPQNNEEYYILQQESYMTLEPWMDGKTLTCEIETSYPHKSSTASYVINVLLPDPTPAWPGHDKGEDNDELNNAVAPEKKQKEEPTFSPGSNGVMVVMLVLLCIFVLAVLALGFGLCTWICYRQQDGRTVSQTDTEA